MKKFEYKRRVMGFTLVELLAVIVILALILAIAVPSISSIIDSSTQSAFESNAKLLMKAIDLKVLEDSSFDPTTLTSANASILLNIDTSNYSSIAVSTVEGKPQVTIVGGGKWKNLRAVGSTGSVTISVQSIYADASGASYPELSAGMIPVSYNGSNWVKANLNTKWYDYATQEWANAVLVNSSTRATYQAAASGTIINEADIMAYLVWVPRYRYQLFNVSSASVPTSLINIAFEDKLTAKSSGNTNGSWLTHPAFTMDTTELSGLWAGKFETTGSSGTPTIKPNSSALVNMNISSQFAASQLFNNNTIYGLTTTNDAHMVKEMEWGAVTYLSYSIYGKYGNPTYTGATGLEKDIWINNSSTQKTGCAGTVLYAAAYAGCQSTYTTTNGVKASTTGNVYGIYDMAGGVWEYVMGGLLNNGTSTLMISSTGFVQATIDSASMAKYITKYIYGTTNNDQAAYNRRILGDATGETRGFVAVAPSMAYNLGPWNSRGGANFSTNRGTPFSMAAYTGQAVSDTGFRIAIIGG